MKRAIKREAIELAARNVLKVSPNLPRSALITAVQVSTGASIGYTNSVINGMGLYKPTPKPNWFDRLIAPFAFWVKA